MTIFPIDVDVSEAAALMFARSGQQAIVRITNDGDRYERLPSLADLPSSESLFRRLATECPAELLRRMASEDMTPGLLARAAEAAGRIADSREVTAALIPLLRHRSPVVREGSIYGLVRHPSPEVVAAIARVVDDPTTTPGVRDVAREALEDLEA